MSINLSPSSISSADPRLELDGRDQLYHSCLIPSWEQAIDSLHYNLPIPDHQIMVQMVQTVWHYVLATWTLHNHHLH